MKEILKLLKIIIILLPIYGLWIISRDSEIPILFVYLLELFGYIRLLNFGNEENGKWQH